MIEKLRNLTDSELLEELDEQTNVMCIMYMTKCVDKDEELYMLCLINELERRELDN